ncbi:GNAT family N-acetyltransferase [Methylosinus sporium]|uniref:GNAT family N-acetyltransferase n=1 Tax=Methylosinus sporium TaxID=428 RepID=A0A549SDL3_METSR|nr:MULTISPECIES: GNAT family N-acetyltransferase [Methylosinus]MBU3886929.1 GNAT family N-acetyltransferase [Methylosinus sp. KRF6]TRL26559.1 GNAT family N-acetyltransferase [Methylosinus sporium]
MSGGGPIIAPRIVARRDSDWPALLDLWVAAWRTTYADIDFEARRDWLRDRLVQLERGGAQTLLLLEGAGRALIGFVTVDPRTHWLDQLCVRPDRFGSGAAEALIEAARSLSPARLRLDVNQDNRRAVAFYEREGFMRIAEGGPSLSGRPTSIMEWTTDGAPKS